MGKKPSNLRYGWASITAGTRNHGNAYIRYCLRRALDLPEPSLTFDSFRPLPARCIDEVNRTCAFVVSPGCTTLQRGQNPAFESFDRIEVPKPCFGGCLWAMGRVSRALRAWRMLQAPAAKQASRPEADTTIAHYMTEPVGVRDPYTLDTLRRDGVEASFIGCPTLLAPQPPEKWRRPEGKRLVVSLSRCGLPRQLGLLAAWTRRYDVAVLIHERYERHFARLIKGVELVEFESPEQFFGHYRDADIVVTGRLHGALPAISAGTPVVFYGDDRDTRFSLLTYLGLPVRPLDSGLRGFEELPEVKYPDKRVLERVYELRGRFADYARIHGIDTTLAM